MHHGKCRSLAPGHHGISNSLRPRLYIYIFLGQYLPTATLMILGAAIGGALPNVPTWSEAYDSYSVGGVVTVMLTSTAGTYGKVIAVLLALTLTGVLAAAM